MTDMDQREWDKMIECIDSTPSPDVVRREVEDAKRWLADKKGMKTEIARLEETVSYFREENRALADRLADLKGMLMRGQELHKKLADHPAMGPRASAYHLGYVRACLEALNNVS